MKKHEFRQALKRNRMTIEEFALLTGRHVQTVYAFGDSTPIPIYARTMLKVIDEIGSERVLFLAGLKKNRQIQ